MAHRKQLINVCFFFPIPNPKIYCFGTIPAERLQRTFLVKKEACSGEKVESRNMSGQVFLYLRPWVVQPLPFPSSPLTGREQALPGLVTFLHTHGSPVLWPLGRIHCSAPEGGCLSAGISRSGTRAREAVPLMMPARRPQVELVML